MAWVGLLALLALAGFALYVAGSGLAHQSYVLLAAVFAGLGLIVRLLVLALGRKGKDPD